MSHHDSDYDFRPQDLFGLVLWVALLGSAIFVSTRALWFDHLKIPEKTQFIVDLGTAVGTVGLVVVGAIAAVYAYRTAIAAIQSASAAQIQAQAALQQVKVTQRFEIARLTKEVIDDPSDAAFGAFFRLLNDFKHDIVKARFALTVQNRLSFSGLENKEMSKVGGDLNAALTYIAALSSRDLIDNDLYFERHAIDVVLAYYCYQGVIDYSYRHGYQQIDIGSFARRAFDWLKSNRPRSLKNYPPLLGGFASPSELSEVNTKAYEEAERLKSGHDAEEDDFNGKT